jgi:hypothetical protein
MFDILNWLLFVVFIGALIVVGFVLLRGYLTTGSPTGGLSGSFFGPKPDRRLDVVEQLNVDGRRRLLLVRRDEVEHLIMTGGPVDVVIETGIGEKPRGRQASDAVEPVPAVFTRPARFGQATGSDG